VSPFSTQHTRYTRSFPSRAELPTVICDSTGPAIVRGFPNQAEIIPCLMAYFTRSEFVVMPNSSMIWYL